MCPLQSTAFTLRVEGIPNHSYQYHLKYEYFDICFIYFDGLDQGPRIMMYDGPSIIIHYFGPGTPRLLGPGTPRLDVYAVC